MSGTLHHLPMSTPRTPATRTARLPAELAWRALEEVDFGLVLVEPDGTLHHANHLARHELARERFLRLVQGAVAGIGDERHKRIAAGLRLAGSGRRQLITLDQGGDSLSVACVPLGLPGDGLEPPLVLMMLGRQAGDQAFAVSFFARAHGLTPAEETVLRALCAGRSVREITRENGVAESTVRTQIRSLRDKAGAPSIRQLVQRIAALPPVVPVGLSMAAAPAAQCWA